MDPGDRTDLLFAQLDLLLAQGRLDAARAVVARLDAEVRGANAEALANRNAERRDLVLAPLADLLRRQRSLARDIRRQASLIADDPELDDPDALQKATEQEGTAVRGALGEWLLARTDDGAGLLSHCTDALASLSASLRDGRPADAREAIGDLLELLRHHGGDEPPVELIARLKRFDALLAQRTAADEIEAICERQTRLIEQITPLYFDPVASQHSFSLLQVALTQARDSMTDVRVLLDGRSLDDAGRRAETATDTLAETLRWVEEAWGAGSGARSDSPIGAFVARRLPEWELPRALGSYLHDLVEAQELDRERRRALVRVLQALDEASPAAVDVQLQRRLPDEPGNRSTLDLAVYVASAAGPERYKVRLTFETSTDGSLAPSPEPDGDSLLTLGGRADVLLRGELPDASVLIARLFDDGPGPCLDYTIAAEAPALRDRLRGVLVNEVYVAESQACPVRREVLGWLDSLTTEPADGPLSEDELRQLGIPWYDVADLVDRLRPVIERLQIQLLVPRDEDAVFPGLCWEGPAAHVLVHLHTGSDGRTPTIALRRSLLSWIASEGDSPDRGESRMRMGTALAALCVHLGLKLALFDQLRPERWRRPTHRAARSLERGYLAAVGLPPSALTDLLARLVTLHAADEQDGSWSQAARNLLEARAGETFLKERRLPPSMLYGAYREALVRQLKARGQLAAARSAEDLAIFRDAAVLFGNLVIAPDGSGVLIVGDSKIGKSSITARLVTGDRRHDAPPWQFGASDRVLVLSPDPKAPPERFEGAPAPLAGPSPAHRTFGQKYTQELWYRDADQREVHPADQVVFQGLAPLRTIVLVRREGGERRGPGLPPPAIASLLRDFQERYDFPASRRFWWDVLASVSLVECTLKRRGSDTFHEAARAIREASADAAASRGLGREAMRVKDEGPAWWGVEDHGSSIEVTRVGGDGLDLIYRVHADGSVRSRPVQLGLDVECVASGGFDLGGVSHLVSLDPSRLTQRDGVAHHQLASGRLVPLHPEYFRATRNGPAFLVPALPPSVHKALGATMARSPSTWARWLGQPLPPRRSP